MKKFYSLLLCLGLVLQSLNAASVKVTMNATSPTMSLADKSSGTSISVGEPANKVYSFEAPAGSYVLTAYASNGETVNGTIELTVAEGADNEFTVLTCTAYATNKEWSLGVDYTFSVEVNTREGGKQAITVGQSSTAGRSTFLALKGNSYYAMFVPSEARQTEGYMSLYKSGTLTSNFNVNGAIPMGADYAVTLPQNASFQLGMKFAHYIAFHQVEPVKVETDEEAGLQKLTYRLADGQVYNYRTWGLGLTQAGYFTMKADSALRPNLAFTLEDYQAFGSCEVKHDVQWNGGYETGDIFLNVNERGHLRMKVGDKFEAHPMRSWELTDNSMNNYFIEPDFHYFVTDLEGNHSENVIEIENWNPTVDPWTSIRAVGKGTVIVEVTYDAIGLNYYASGKTAKTPYLGGEYWSAIWPENTGVFVITVGDEETDMDPNMLINEAYNASAMKLSGKYVDAEHDVFYYLDTTEGAEYTFAPKGVSQVELAYPQIDRMATYHGFGTQGVTLNEDGSYTLLLKEGRNIVRLTDAEGRSIYQVLTAKPCHREISNLTNEGSSEFCPGEKVMIQYSGLRHPANKMAGIYNMSAYVTYNGIPNGTSLILGKGQYTFGSAASAQAVTITIPEDYTDNVLRLDSGVIQVNGYGDPIGNHRYTSRTTGRSANFTAVAHKSYFGAIPSVEIPVASAFADHVNFEDVDLNGAAFYNGADNAGLFASSGYSFLNYFTDYGGGSTFWCGFAASAAQGKNFSGSYTDDTQYNSCVGGGMRSKQFALGYYSDYFKTQCPEIYATKAFKPEYVYVTNSACALQVMAEGNTFSKKFTAQDWFKLTITGLTSEDEVTGSVDFYLAKDSVFVTEWTKVDLSSLGAVDHLRFTMDSSDKTSYGINTPTYFCLDNMKSELTDDAPVAIEAVTEKEAKAMAASVYTLDGRKSAAPQRGMNVVRMSDGSARVIFVK